MLVALALVAAAPQAAERQWMQYGYPGSDSCADWTKNRRTKLNQALEGWALGFLSGFNAFGRNGGGGYDGANTTSILAWMDNYCETNPLDTTVLASMKLVEELKKRRAAL